MCDCKLVAFRLIGKGGSFESWLYLNYDGQWTDCVEKEHAHITWCGNIRPIVRQFIASKARTYEDAEAVCLDCGLVSWSYLHS